MEQPKISPALSLWRYFRTKGRNAWWVLKTKGLRGVWRNLVNEITWLSGRYTVYQANAEVVEAAPGGQEQPAPRRVPDSAFVNRRKVLPPSPRPTRLALRLAAPSAIDRAAIAQALDRIKGELRHSSAIKGRLSHDDQ